MEADLPTGLIEMLANQWLKANHSEGTDEAREILRFAKWLDEFITGKEEDEPKEA